MRIRCRFRALSCFLAFDVAGYYLEILSRRDAVHLLELKLSIPEENSNGLPILQMISICNNAGTCGLGN